MVPTPEQVLADIQRALDDIIVPALPEGFVREQASLMGSLIEHLRLRLELEPTVLIEDNADLLATLDKHGLTPTTLASLPHRDVPIEQLRQYNEALSAALQRALASRSAGETDASCGENLRSLAARQLMRQKRMLGRGYVIGT